MNTEKLLRKVIIGAFIIVPIISSIISALHIVDFYTLGNPTWLAVALAIAIELGSIASFLTLSILDKLNKGIVWTVFIILFFMQVVGNMYFSYNYIAEMIKTSPGWIDSFKSMIEFFLGEMDLPDVIMYLTIIIAWPIPIVSVFLLKSAIDYLKPEVANTIAPSKDSKTFYDLNANERESLRNKLKDIDTEPEKVESDENNSEV